MLSRLAELDLGGENSIVLEKFPLHPGGGRANPRAYAEWLKRAAISGVRSKAGAIGGASVKQMPSNCLSKPESIAPTPTTTTTSTSTATSSPPPPPSGEPPAGAGVVCVSPDSPPSLFPGGEERLSSGESASKKKKAAEAEKPDPWGWDEFAAVYPGFRLKPDRACKAWFGKNIRDRATLDRLLDSVRAWLRSEQWIGGVVPNCSKFCDEGIWLAEPGPPPRGSVQARQEDNRAAMAGAARILGFDKEVPNDAS